MRQSIDAIEPVPLLSPSFVWRLTAAVALLCALTIAISIAGRVFGRSLVSAGHTEDTSLLEIVIGNDVLLLPANVIRFESQRAPGVHERLDTYFAWPGMRGYSRETSDVFNRADRSGTLIFAHLSQATMSRDMSGRFGPIYSRLIEGSPVAGPAGLVSYRMRPGTGYANELVYVGESGGGEPYVVRCLIDTPDNPDFATQTGCQRDIAIGTDLSLVYRFSVDRLSDWQAIESAVRTRFEQALAAADRSKG